MPSKTQEFYQHTQDFSGGLYFFLKLSCHFRKSQEELKTAKEHEIEVGICNLFRVYISCILCFSFVLFSNHM